MEQQREKWATKIAEREERTAEARRCAEDDRQDVIRAGEELKTLYTHSDELCTQTRVVSLLEIEENEFNLNITRYVDTFEPEPRLEVRDAREALVEAQDRAKAATGELSKLLEVAGYGR